MWMSLNFLGRWKTRTSPIVGNLATNPCHVAERALPLLPRRILCGTSCHSTALCFVALFWETLDKYVKQLMSVTRLWTSILDRSNRLGELIVNLEIWQAAHHNPCICGLHFLWTWSIQFYFHGKQGTNKRTMTIPCVPCIWEQILVVPCSRKETQLLRILFLLEKAGEELPPARSESEVQKELQVMANQIKERMPGWIVLQLCRVYGRFKMFLEVGNQKSIFFVTCMWCGTCFFAKSLSFTVTFKKFLLFFLKLFFVI